MKKVIHPFEGVGRFTSFPNDAIDYVMPLCKPNTWRVVCVIIRQTIGWHKDEDELSLSQIMERTGIGGRSNAQAAVMDALSEGFIVRRKVGRGFLYRINRQYQVSTDISTKLVPPAVPERDTQKKEKEKKQTGVDVLIDEFAKARFGSSWEKFKPDWNKPAATNKTWATPLREILKLTDGDIAVAIRLVRRTVGEMKQAGLTFDKPVQILASARSKYGDQLQQWQAQETYD